MNLRQRLVRLLRYGGGKYRCPFCGFMGRKFIPNNKDVGGQAAIDAYHIVPMGKRPNHACPGCGSTDKERLVWAHLSSQRLPRDGDKVLHIAPEMVTQRKLSRRRLAYHPGDNFEGERARDGRYADLTFVDVTDIKFDENYFDLIICNHVLEHVQNDRHAMRELYRVLKPGGTAILQVPVSMTLVSTVEDPLISSPEERTRVFGQADHVRIYGREDYVQRLTEAGFKVKVLSSTEVAQKHWATNPDELLFVAEK